MSTALSAERHDVGSSAAPFCQRQYVICHSLHHPLVLRFISVAVVHVGDPAFAVVLYSVHGVAAEAAAGDGRSVSSAQIVRRDFALGAETRADVSHRRRKAQYRRRAAASAGEDKTCK